MGVTERTTKSSSGPKLGRQGRGTSRDGSPSVYRVREWKSSRTESSKRVKSERTGGINFHFGRGTT